MKRRFVLLLACSIALVLCFCQGTKKDDIAGVGGTTLTQKDLDAFKILARYFPKDQGEFSLLARTAISGLAETEALFQKGRRDLGTPAIRRNQDWLLKTRYFTSLCYTMEILQRNLGFSDEQLKGYYEANKDRFRGVESIDSTGKVRLTKAAQPFPEMKFEVAKKMFLEKYKPDSAAVKEIKRALMEDKMSPLAGAKTASDSTTVIRDQWAEYIRDPGYRDFFLDLYYKEKFGRPFPGTLTDVYGKNKYITPAEMEAVLSWMPDNRRSGYKDDPLTLMDFARWIARWKLFSEKAKKSGFAAKPATQDLLKWAWKVEIAQRYVDTKLVPAAKKTVSIDTSMARYSYWDENGCAGQLIDSVGLKAHLAKLVSQETAAKFDSLIYEIRKGMHVRFFQPGDGYSDQRVKDPAMLLRQADSLRDTGKTTEAQALYQTLVTSFVFTGEGKKALVELAKIQTEQMAYTEAIKNYRWFLITDPDKSKQYNSMFMIGFIYDKYLDRPEMAELNYKWVLKNAPECELADDAEFMMLHLGEPMPGTGELQAEASRQGKKAEVSPN